MAFHAASAKHGADRLTNTPRHRQGDRREQTPDRCPRRTAAADLLTASPQPVRCRDGWKRQGVESSSRPRPPLRSNRAKAETAGPQNDQRPAESRWVVMGHHRVCFQKETQPLSPQTAQQKRVDEQRVRKLVALFEQVAPPHHVVVSRQVRDRSGRHRRHPLAIAQHERCLGERRGGAGLQRRAHNVPAFGQSGEQPFRTIWLRQAMVLRHEDDVGCRRPDTGRAGLVNIQRFRADNEAFRPKVAVCLLHVWAEHDDLEPLPEGLRLPGLDRRLHRPMALHGRQDD